MQELYTPAQIQSILQPVFTEHNIKKAVLFGSYAKGAARAQSDIDILMLSPPLEKASICWTYPSSRRIPGWGRKSRKAG